MRTVTPASCGTPKRRTTVADGSPIAAHVPRGPEGRWTPRVVLWGLGVSGHGSLLGLAHPWRGCAVLALSHGGGAPSPRARRGDLASGSRSLSRRGSSWSGSLGAPWGLGGGRGRGGLLGESPGALFGVVVPGRHWRRRLATRRQGRARRHGMGPPRSASCALSAFFVWVIARQPFACGHGSTARGTDFLRHLWIDPGRAGVGLLVPGDAGLPAGASTPWRPGSTRCSGCPPTADVLVAGGRAAHLPDARRSCCMAVMSRASAPDRSASSACAPRVVAAVLAAIAFVQTAWFSTFLAFGQRHEHDRGSRSAGRPRPGLRTADPSARVRAPRAALVASWRSPPTPGSCCCPWSVSRHYRGSSSSSGAGGGRRAAGSGRRGRRLALHGDARVWGLTDSTAGRTGCRRRSPTCSVPTGGGGSRLLFALVAIVGRVPARPAVVGRDGPGH